MSARGLNPRSVAQQANPELRQFLIDDVSLMAVAQPGRIPMMELLVRHGADVNGLRWGWFPVLFTPCENLEPEPLQWLLDKGADPNRGNPNDPGTALDYVIGTYPRDPERLTACIEMLLAAGAHTRYDVPGVLPIVRGRTDELAALLDANSRLLHRRSPELDCGQSGGRLVPYRLPDCSMFPLRHADAPCTRTCRDTAMPALALTTA